MFHHGSILSRKYLEKYFKYGMPCASEHSETKKIPFYTSWKQSNYVKEIPNTKL